MKLLCSTSSDTFTPPFAPSCLTCIDTVFPLEGIPDIRNRLAQFAGHVAVRQLLQGGEIQPLPYEGREAGLKIINGNTLVGQNRPDEAVVYGWCFVHKSKYNKNKVRIGFAIGSWG